MEIVIDDVATFAFTLVIALAAGVQVIVFTLSQMHLSRLQKRLNWLTGSMESYDRNRLILELQNGRGEVVWWDPNHRRDGTKDWGTVRDHRAAANVNRVHIGIPLDARARTNVWLWLGDLPNRISGWRTAMRERFWLP